MNLEYNIFKKSIFNYDKLLKYGFIKEKEEYTYTKNIINNKYQINIIIKDNKVSTKIYDLVFNDEYLNFLVDSNLSINNQIKEEYLNILNDIKLKCTESKLFIFNESNEISNYIKRKYKINPEFLWKDNNGVFRNKINKKWFAIIQNISKNKLDSNYPDEDIEIINLKLDEQMINNLLNEKGFYKAYHMNKKYWITIILDNSIDKEIIYSLIDLSFNNINKK